MKTAQVQLKSGEKKVVYLDPIFFHKSQITVGTNLQYMGRLDPLSMWQVTRIVSFDLKSGKVTNRHYITECNHLSDDVYLKCTRGESKGQTRCASFGYLSYSAIWRLA